VFGSTGVLRYVTPPKPSGFWNCGSLKLLSHQTIVWTSGRNAIWSSPASPTSGSMAMATIMFSRSYGPGGTSPDATAGVLSALRNSVRLNTRNATKTKSCTDGTPNAKIVSAISTPAREPWQSAQVPAWMSLAAMHTVSSAKPGNG
jgi:hypothetical protein